MNRIAVNIGNSRISAALFRKGVMVESWHHDTADAAGAAVRILETAAGSPVSVSSVVPAAAGTIVDLLAGNGVVVRLIKAGEQKLIAGCYETMGADRVANAAAGWKLFARGGPVIVIDLGTATTLTAVTSEGAFAGGLITLGLGRTLSGLHRDAALLPNIDIENDRPHPSPLAFDTESAIVSGTILAHVGLVEYWIKLAARGLGGQPATVATGGWSNTLAGYTRAIEQIDPYLTLKGIYLIAEAEAVPADPG